MNRTASSSNGSLNVIITTPSGEKSVTISDPFGPDQHKEIEWLLEQHPIYDPFSLTRAQSCRKALQKYAEELEKQLRLPPKNHQGDANRGESIQVNICSQTPELALQGLYWEALEHYGSRKYSVRRLITPENLSPTFNDESNATTDNVVRVLLLTARSIKSDVIETDVTNRLASGAILKVLKKLRKERMVQLDVVRPATLQALREALGKRPDGYCESDC